MKSSKFYALWLFLSAIASVALHSSFPVQAVTFGEQEVNQGQFTVVAVPFGYQEHRVEIIEQIPQQQQCWQESGTAPVKVELLLLNFDYNGSCRRIINTNGYSLRLNGQDDHTAYVIKVVQQQGELKLLAMHKDPNQPALEIGSTQGLNDGAMKIILNPGWKIAKRVHEGETLNHLYLSGTTNSNYSESTNVNTSAGNSASSSSANTTKVSNSQNKTTTEDEGINQIPAAPSPEEREALVNRIDDLYNNVLSPILEDFTQEKSSLK